MNNLKKKLIYVIDYLFNDYLFVNYQNLNMKYLSKLVF